MEAYVAAGDRGQMPDATSWMHRLWRNLGYILDKVQTDVIDEFPERREVKVVNNLH